MSKDWRAIARETVQGTAALYKESQKVMGSYSQLAQAASADGAMSRKTKELMALAISVVIRCEGCIAYHTQAAIKAGAERQEFIEAVEVALELGGGPAAVYGAEALEAYDQLSG